MVHINPTILAAHDPNAAKAFDVMSDAVDDLNVLVLATTKPVSSQAAQPLATTGEDATFTRDDPNTFRQYETACARVKNFYLEQHTKQTVEFNFAVREYFESTRGQRARMGVWDALELLDGLIDESDPDTSLSQIEHALQTAEAMRRAGKPEWMQAVGLVHDLGKLLFFWNFPGKEFERQFEVANEDAKGPSQWSVVGDTFPVGCAYAPAIVLSDSTFQSNPDLKNERYSTECGIYEPGCGIDNLIMCWGHDEYLYRVLKDKCLIPKEGMAMIRYHSFYPWHRDNAYTHFMAPGDEDLLQAVRDFNPFDLYSKADDAPDLAKLKGYYQGVVSRWFPEEVDW